MEFIGKHWLFASVYLLHLCWNISAISHPDVYLSLEQRIKRHGYPLEVHKVTTEDGYILSAYRIPHGTEKPYKKTTNRSVVLLMHGMGGSPHNWILLGGRDSLPYYLADRGFEVWLGTVRGVKGSFNQQHKTYDWNEDSQYWDYCLHEIGVYDLPANIDYILSYTNQSKLFFIGHSAATPQFFILLSERPEYNAKIKIGVQYASAPKLKRMEYSLALFLASLEKVWRGVFKYLGLVEFFPQAQIFVPTLIELCQDPKFIKACVQIGGIIGSSNSVLMEDEIIIIAVTSIQRLSANMIIHFMQNVNDGDFRKFNYGKRKNMRLYGQVDPPRYNLSSCTAPVAFFYGPKDSLCVKGDVYESMNIIPNVILDYEVPFLKYTHLDFIMGRNSTFLVYEPTYRLFRDYDIGKIPAKVGKRDISN